MHGRSILSSHVWQIDRTVSRSPLATETAQRKRTPVRAFESLTHGARFDGDDPPSPCRLCNPLAQLRMPPRQTAMPFPRSVTVGRASASTLLRTPTSPHDGRAELTQLPSFVRFAGTALHHARSPSWSTIALDRPDGSSRQDWKPCQTTSDRVEGRKSQRPVLYASTFHRQVTLIRDPSVMDCHDALTVQVLSANFCF